MTTVVVVVVVVVALASYLTWTAGRLDRLHQRVEAARVSLEAQLLRRAAAALELGGFLLSQGLDRPEVEELHRAARTALAQPEPGREQAENALSGALRSAVRALHSAAGPQGAAALPAGSQSRLVELDRAVVRVGLARHFHNDAVRDTRALRERRLPRWLRLAGHAALPAYFEIDDTALGLDVTAGPPDSAPGPT